MNKLPSNVLSADDSGAAAFRKLCNHFGVAVKQRSIRARNRSFEIVGLNGRPVKKGLQEYLSYEPSQFASDEDDTFLLEVAIENCDPTAIRAAVAAGASLQNVSADGDSALVSALYEAPKNGWEECAETLIELGAPSGWLSR